MLKNNFILGLKFIFNLASLILYPKTNGVLFHGYMGEIRGNTLALYNYMLKDKNINHDFFGQVKMISVKYQTDLSLKATPERNAPLREHIKFLFFLV